MARQTRLEGAIIPTPKEGSIIEYYTQDADGNISLNVKRPDGSIQVISASATKDKDVDVGVIGARLRGEWSPLKTYIENDIVTYDSNLYVCRKENAAITPGANTSDCWTLYVAKGKDALSLVVRGEWDAEEYYSKDDWVVYNGSMYVALQDTKGHSPEESLYWLHAVHKGSDGAKGDIGEGLSIDAVCEDRTLLLSLDSFIDNEEGFLLLNASTGEVYTLLLNKDTGERYWSTPFSIKGVPGEQGKQGPEGPPGPAPEIHIDKVITKEYGEEAEAYTSNVDGKVFMELRLPKGPKGDSFTINIVGTSLLLHNYDGEAKGFSFYADDTGNLYIKNSDAYGDWSSPMNMKGPYPLIHIGKVTAAENYEEPEVTATQNGLNVTMDMKLPRGPIGRPFTIDIVGNEVDRYKYNAEKEGFSYYSQDTGFLYIKNSDASQDWCPAMEIKGRPVTAKIGTVTTVMPKEKASVTVDNTDAIATFNFNVPKGDVGRPFLVDEVGLEADRSSKDNKELGYSYYSQDTGLLYIKRSDANADWCPAMDIKGPPVSVDIGDVTALPTNTPAYASVTQEGSLVLLNFGLPRGNTGRPFMVDAVGPYAELVNKADEVEGYAYYTTDTGLLYIKRSDAHADWCPAMDIKGPPIILKIGTVETIEHSEPAEVEVSQDGAIATINFKIPMGRVGQQGPSGSFYDAIKSSIIMG